MKLESLPKGINDRLMVMRLPLKGTYAPTMSYTQEQKELFYQNLSSLLHTKLVVLGDFNARVGKDSQSWPDVIGLHGVGQESSKGQLLLTFCAEYGLTITNTLFQLSGIHKVTWMHPRSRHWHLIDLYVITRLCDIQDAHITRVMGGAHCGTDHLLLRGKFSFSIGSSHRCQKAGILKKLDVQKLADPETRESLRTNLADQLQSLPDEADLKKAWANFRDAVYNSAKLMLGYPQRKHQDWFDSNIMEISNLLKQKQEAFNSWLNDKESTAKHNRFRHLRSKAQAELRQMKDKWWEAKTAELQRLADENNSKKSYACLKTMYGPSSSAIAPVRSADGTLLMERHRTVVVRPL